MKQRIRTYLVALLIAIVTAVLVLFLSEVISLVDAASLTISILAIIFSAISAFKNEIFPFRLVVFADVLYLTSMPLISNPNVTTVQVLLPITFFNKGYSEGIIETVKLVVKGEKSGSSHDFLPSFEIDM